MTGYCYTGYSPFTFRGVCGRRLFQGRQFFSCLYSTLLKHFPGLPPICRKRIRNESRPSVSPDDQLVYRPSKNPRRSRRILFRYSTRVFFYTHSNPFMRYLPYRHVREVLGIFLVWLRHTAGLYISPLFGSILYHRPDLCGTSAFTTLIGLPFA